MTKRYFITIFCTGVLLLTSMPGCTVVNPEMGVTDGYNTYDDNYYYDDDRDNDYEDDRDNDYEDSDRIPPVVFYEQPQLVVIPDTYIYVAPDVNDDIFFYDGWWWRPWNGSWYRSHHYSKGWRHYRDVPRFYRDIPGNWRSEYRKHRWKGHEWNHKRIPYKNLERNRNEWEKREKRRDSRDNKHDRYERVNPERNQNDRRERYKRERNNNERQDRFNPENRQDNNNRRERIITPANPEPNNNNRRERIIPANPEPNRNNRRERIIPEQNNRNRERPVTPEVEHNNNNNRRERYNRQEREAAPQPKKPEELLNQEYPKEQSQRHKKGPLDPIETP